MTEQPRGRRRALLIAHARYADPRFHELRAPTGDVEGLAAVLADIGGFDVERVVDQSTDVVKQRIEAFFTEEGSPEDMLLLYISGHGVMAEDRSLYFATSSTKFDRLESTGIEAGFVDRQTRRPRARSVVVILDCCHSGAFGPGRTPKGTRSVHIEDRFPPTRPREHPAAAGGAYGHVVLTASNELEYAFEDTNLNALDPSEPGSIFTHFLVKGLRTGQADRDRDGFIAIGELYDYAFIGTRGASPHQTPMIFARTGGSLIIAPAPSQPAPKQEPEQAPEQAPGPEQVKPDPTPPPAAMSFTHGDVLRSVAFNPEETQIVTAGDDRIARVWDLDTGHELHSIVHPARGRSRKLWDVAFSHDAKRIATACRDNTARVWDLSDGGQLVCITHRGWVRAVSFSRDGKFVASAGDDRSGCLWNLAEGRRQQTITSDMALNAVAFSRDGGRWATAGHYGSACVWDVNSGEQLDSVTHEDAIWDVTFGPDATQLATAGSDHTARLWTLGKDLAAVVLDHPGPVWSVAFSPDGRRVATSGHDIYARVWDVDDPREPSLKLPHDDVVFRVAFSSKGRLLATACADGTAKVWEV